MKYALRRGKQWVTAPKGDGDPIPPKLEMSNERTHAWLAPTIDIAIERQHLLRICWGWATSIEAIR